MIIKATNPKLDGEYSFLVGAHISGVSTLYVQRADVFDSNFIQIEEYGNEAAEIMRVTSRGLAVTPNTLTLSGQTRFTHVSNSKVLEQRYNQVYLYRASASGITFNSAYLSSITPDHEWTEINDSTGVSTDYGKIKYWDSVAAAGSDLSDEFAYAGFSRITASEIVRRAKSLVNYKRLENPGVGTEFNTDDEWLDWLNDGLVEIAMRVNLQALFTSTTFTADGTEAKTLPSNFMRDQLVKYGSSTYIQASLGQYHSASSTQGFYTINGSQLLIGSAPTSSDSIYLYYYKRPATVSYNTTDVDLEDDTTKALVYYMAAEYHAKQENWQSHDRMFAKYERQLEMIKDANALIMPTTMPLVSPNVINNFPW